MKYHTKEEVEAHIRAFENKYHAIARNGDYVGITVNDYSECPVSGDITEANVTIHYQDHEETFYDLDYPPLD